MDNIQLNDQLSFGIETYARGLRLMVFDRNEVWVCHKVRVKVLKDFIQAEGGHLFKGRLQLDKTNGHIQIQVKGNTAGVIVLDDFVKLIS